MSFTTLVGTPEKITTIHLSPSKRKRAPSETRLPSTTELLTWTHRTDAIALCSVHDAMSMKKNNEDGREFYWLGRVPCRSVKLVGMIVGIQVYEKRIIYTIDDGTDVIDCNHAFPQNKLAQAKTTEPPESLKPIAPVGHTVGVIGSVRETFQSRSMLVNHIEECDSPNNELLHTRSVVKLHKLHYSLKDPFIIPTSQTKDSTIFQTPSKAGSSPPASSSPQTSVYSSPAKSSPIKSSPLKADCEGVPEPKSPPRLRHPSRLHTQDLTENTFRIYVKHYMVNAPPIQDSNDPGYDDSDAAIGWSIAQMPSTPTKRSRLHIDDTPRQSSSSSRYPTADATPKPSVPSSTSTPSKPTPAGFTLSYLRRVPELSLLASRVVQAVAKRRQREERKKMKEAGAKSQPKASSSSSSIPPDKFAAKMKRLFQWAIIQLHKEGGIVHWDGPIRRCPEPSTMMDASRLWKAHSTSASLLADSTLFSSTSSTTTSVHPPLDDDSGFLSDPQPDEESYMPLTPVLLAEHVERAVKVLVEQYLKMGKPYLGATADGILSVLSHDDDRWRYVGAWTVEETLVWLKKEGRVWSSRKGRWDLTM